MNPSDLKFYLALSTRWLPFVLVIWALATGIAVGVALLLPPVYRSTATILVESQQISESLAQSTVNISSVEQIQVLQQQLLTRANLLQIAADFEIFKDQPGLSPTEIVDLMTGATEFDQSQLGGSRNNAGTIIFDISFSANTANQAANVTNQLATLILEQNVKSRTDRASGTMQFFQNSVNELGTELAQLEAEILDFRLANESSLPDSLTFRRDQVTILQERLLQLERDIVALEESRAALELAMETRDSETAISGQLTPNQIALTALRNNLSQQLAIFSESNPNIVALKSRIAALEGMVREEAATTVVPAGGALPSTLGGQLEQVVARLEATQSQGKGINDEIAALMKSISGTPANEVKLNSLQRNYENIRVQYVDAQKKLSEAATGEQLELRQKGERFEMIEQPTVPDAPIRPNRKLVGVGGSLVGLMLGAVIAAMFEFMNKSIRRPADLIRKLEIQPFATIPYIETRGEVLRSRLRTSSLIIATAGGIPAALFLIHYYYTPLDLLLQQATEKSGISGLMAKYFG